MRSCNPSLRSVVDQDGAVILDVERDAVVSLNATGGYIWDRLLKGKLIEEIVVDLARDTGAELAVVERDVHDFIDQLKSRHLFADSTVESQRGGLR